MIEGIVKTVAGWGAGILAAILIATVVKEGLQYIKGSGSVSLWSILGKVIILVLMLGFILLTSDYGKNYGPFANLWGQKVVNTTSELANELIGGGGTAGQE